MPGEQTVWGLIGNNIASIRFIDVIDVIVVTIIYYQLIKFVRNTRAFQLLKGILFFVIMMQAAMLFNMKATSFLLNSTLQFGVLALLIVFQPELRKILEKFGRGGMKKFIISDDINVDVMTPELVKNIVDAAFILSSTKTGALIAFEKETKLGDIVNTGTQINADITSEVLQTIFFHNSPLHDGAVIISKAKIVSAGCLLPLTENTELSSELGTRHRAAIGLSEITDALVLVVSEETGTISVAIGGVLKRGFTKQSLTEQLTKYIINTDEFIPKKFIKKRRGNK